VTWLSYPREPASDVYAPGDPRIEPLEAIILHYTASRPGKTSAVRRWLTSRDQNYVSAHFTVDRDGAVVQHAPLDARTFHAGGASSWLFGRRQVNHRTLGIELANVGPVTIRRGLPYDASGRPCGDIELVRPAGAGGGVGDDDGLWEQYPEVQLTSLLVLLAHIHEALETMPGGVVAPGRLPLPLRGHEEVDPSRKTDPGPAFPWDRFRDDSLWLTDRVLATGRLP
jgi:N-acetylmuramoyl-L-alanine amidase